MRTDGVHRRESAGAGRVVLEVARVTGAAHSGKPMEPLMCAHIFQRPLIVIIDNGREDAEIVYVERAY